MDLSRRKITKIARNATHFARRCAQDKGLGSSEYEVLHAIRKNPGIGPDEICRSLAMEKSAVAHLTAGLEKKGFLRREIDSEDARRRKLYATEKADRLKDSRAALEAQYYSWLLEGIGEEEKAVFLEVLDVLYQRSKEERKNGSAELDARPGAVTAETERNGQ